MVEADAGMIVGGGKGAVYGMRIKGMPGTLFRNNYGRHLHRKDVVCKRGRRRGQAKQNVVTGPGQIQRPDMV